MFSRPVKIGLNPAPSAINALTRPRISIRQLWSHASLRLGDQGYDVGSVRSLVTEFGKRRFSEPIRAICRRSKECTPNVHCRRTDSGHGPNKAKRTVYSL